jgi:hypothetical protein
MVNDPIALALHGAVERALREEIATTDGTVSDLTFHIWTLSLTRLAIERGRVPDASLIREAVQLSAPTLDRY